MSSRWHANTRILIWCLVSDPSPPSILLFLKKDVFLRSATCTMYILWCFPNHTIRVTIPVPPGGLPLLCRPPLVPVFQQITNLTSRLLVLYRHTKISMETRPCPPPRTLYFLVIMGRAPRTSIPITIATLPRTWVRILHLGDWAVTLSPRNHSS